MLFKNVFDVEQKEILETKYDIAIFASGYEKRCTHLPKLIKNRLVDIPIVLGFSEHNNNPQRRINDKFYYRKWSKKINIISGETINQLYLVIKNLIINKEKIKILVDYSSMTRLWVAGLLNRFRFLNNYTNVTIDFCYSVGEHKEKLEPMTVDSILAIPGFEGQLDRNSKSVVIFGLGFDSVATFHVFDCLEPDITFMFLASPAAFPDYPERAMRYNKYLIDNYSKCTLKLPLSSVETTFRYLGEIITSYYDNSNVILVPMGPKPHVLACILICMKFVKMICLRVSGKRSQIENVDTTGSIVSSRVLLQKS